MVSPGVKAVAIIAIVFFSLAKVTMSIAGSNNLIALPSEFTELSKQGMFFDLAATSVGLFAVGERGHILRSLDDGESWQQMTTPTSVTLTSVSFVGDSQGWAVGHEGVILTTRDGGLTWAFQLQGPEQLKLLLGSAQQRLNKLTQITEYGVSAETSHSLADLNYLVSSLERSNQQQSYLPFFDVTFEDAQNGVAVGGFGTVFVTEDSGENWRAVTLFQENPDGYHFYKSLYLGSDLIITGESGLIVTHSGLDDSWSALTTDDGRSIFDALQYDSGVLLCGMQGYLALYDTKNQLVKPVKLDRNLPSLFSIARKHKADGAILTSQSQLFSIEMNKDMSATVSGTETRGIYAVAYNNRGQLIASGKHGITLVEVMHDK